jgi:mannosyltransferase
VTSFLVDERPDAPAVGAPVSARGGSRALGALVAIVAVGIGLRLWRLGFNGLSYDESFTATAARLPVGRLLEFLRTDDSHPPLDYLLRAPLARVGASDAVLRLPSVAFSMAALVLFAMWMRDRGRAGLIATAFLACSPFQILHGGEARMYALLELLGVAGAMLAERWLQRPARWHVAVVAVIVAVAVFDHVSGFLLGAGLFAVAGGRNDRRAWSWRAGVVAAVLLWAVAWGSAFRQQAGGDWVGWIPRTSVASVARAVSGQVTDFQSLAMLVLAGVLVGGWLTWRRDRVLGRVWVAVGVVPFALAAAIGFVSPFLIDRAVTVAAWAPALALGFLGEYVIARGRTFGAALVVAALVAVLAGTVTFLASKQYDSDLAVRHLEAVVRPGDTILTRPARYATLPGYRIGVEVWDGVRPVRVAGISNATGIRSAGVPASGRIWLFSPVSFELSFPGYRECRAASRGDVSPWTDGVTNIRCLERAAGREP